MRTSSGIIAVSRVYAALATLVAAASAAERQGDDAGVPVVYFPLDYVYGGNHKISTNVQIPGSNETLEVVFDQGSDNFWMFGPNATMNWGCTAIACMGPCNESVSPSYDWPASGAHTEPVGLPFYAAYGGFDKIVDGSYSINDTMTFSSAAGQTSTLTDVRAAMADFMLQRLGADDQCSDPGDFDLAIMGLAPYQRSAGWNTTLSIRQDLLERGAVGAPVLSLWFDAAPGDVYGTYTGGGLLGGLDTSKYAGPLVRVPLTTSGSTPSVGYYTPAPVVSVGGVAFDNSDSGVCLIDSGSRSDSLPLAWAEVDAFLNATGLVTTPLGYTSWPGDCNTVPRNRTIDFAFAGVSANELVTVRVPLSNYVRGDVGEAGYCYLNFDYGCTLGGPFALAAFFAANDERGELALAQGAVSERGSGVDSASVVARIP
ncbi:aspartic peptidase domain-containing protein [Xylariaceae sp. FL0804]|nr:aspartic peptidase domain-containing protein [Xylariaceae sp. FL0804]